MVVLGGAKDEVEQGISGTTGKTEEYHKFKFEHLPEAAGGQRLQKSKHQ